MPQFTTVSVICASVHAGNGAAGAAGVGSARSLEPQVPELGALLPRAAGCEELRALSQCLPLTSGALRALLVWSNWRASGLHPNRGQQGASPTPAPRHAVHSEYRLPSALCPAQGLAAFPAPAPPGSQAASFHRSPVRIRHGPGKLLLILRLTVSQNKHL